MTECVDWMKKKEALHRGNQQSSRWLFLIKRLESETDSSDKRIAARCTHLRLEWRAPFSVLACAPRASAAAATECSARDAACSCSVRHNEHVDRRRDGEGDEMEKGASASAFAFAFARRTRAQASHSTRPLYACALNAHSPHSALRVRAACGARARDSQQRLSRSLSAPLTCA